MPASQGGCSHNHDCEAADCGPAYSLYKHIDTGRIRCLNEESLDSCKNVFRAWELRTAPCDHPLRSNEDDPELLLHIPFTGSVKLKAICVVGGPEGTAPSKLKAYINRDDLDFSTVENLAPIQEWDLQDNSTGFIEYPTQVVKFSSVHSLDLYFPSNFGADSTEIHFIGLKGEFSERRREAVQAVYELRPVPSDHKVPGAEQGSNWGLGM